MAPHRFSEPNFRPAWARKHWKNAMFRDFSIFPHTLIFFLLTLSLLTLLFSDCSHYCCCICP
jgi:hypothetical protein